MTLSRWQAQGNIYLVAEAPLTADAVREHVGDADGILEVRGRGRDWIEIAVWNTDGSLAEMSGNGTRIAAAWLMDRTGSDIARVHVGPRLVDVRRVGERLYESDMGEVEVGPREIGRASCRERV